MPTLSLAERAAREIKGVKTCKKCGETKSLADFARVNPKYNKCGRQHACRDCRSKAWAAKNGREWKERQGYRMPPDKKHWCRRGVMIKHKYGITIDQYERMVANARGLCQICGKPEKETKRFGLSIDHCHKTGVIRGVLCSLCNTAIGKFNDDPEILRRAIRYLRRNREGCTVVKKAKREASAP